MRGLFSAVSSNNLPPYSLFALSSSFNLHLRVDTYTFIRKTQGERSGNVTFKFMAEFYLKDDKISAQRGRDHYYYILQWKTSLVLSGVSMLSAFSSKLQSEHPMRGGMLADDQAFEKQKYSAGFKGNQVKSSSRCHCFFMCCIALIEYNNKSSVMSAYDTTYLWWVMSWTQISLHHSRIYPSYTPLGLYITKPVSHDVALCRGTVLILR